MPADPHSYKLDLSSCQTHLSAADALVGGPRNTTNADSTGEGVGGTTSQTNAFALDISSRPADPPSSSLVGKPFLSVNFSCCKVYARIYRSADGAAYRGRCPRCGIPVNFPVGEGGTTVRFFVVR